MFSQDERICRWIQGQDKDYGRGGKRKIMVLSRIDPGKEVTLIDIAGGRGIRSKLYSMGLVPGVNLRVLNRSGSGPVIIAVKNSRLAIGRGMAEKIIVE